MFINNGVQPISIINSNPLTGTATPLSTASIDLSNTPSTSVVSFQISGVYTGALTPQVSDDGVTWNTLTGTPIIPELTGTAAATVLSAAVGVHRIAIAGHRFFRLSAQAAMTGAANVLMVAR